MMLPLAPFSTLLQHMHRKAYRYRVTSKIDRMPLHLGQLRPMTISH